MAFNPIEFITKKLLPAPPEKRMEVIEAAGLTLPQQNILLKAINAINESSGAPAKIAEDPASFAEEWSIRARGTGGIREAWIRTRHLELINAKLTNMVEGKGGKRLIIALPVRHGKTEFATFWFPLWFLAKFPNKRVIVSGHTAEFIETYGRRLRDFVRDSGSELGLFLDPTTTAAHRWNLTTGGSVTAVGRGGALTGRGADLLVLDDMLKDDEEANSEIIRQRLWDWWLTTASTRLEPGGICIVIGTRWHFEDLSGRLEAQNKIEGSEKWEILKLPALAEENDPLGRKEGEALWPERYPIEELNKIKAASTAYWFSAMYQQNPVPEGGGLFKISWWQYWDVLPADFDIVIQSWDLSFKDLKKSDYTVGQVWGRKGAQFYLIDQIREHMNAKDVIQAVRAFSAKYPQARAKLIEDKANGPAVISLLQHEVSGIIPIKVKAGKEARAQAVVPFVQAGNVFLPKPEKAPWVNDALIELLQFPLGSKDDVVDSLTQALNYLAPGGWLQMDRIHSSALGADRALYTNPEQGLQDTFWAAMKKETRKSERRVQKELKELDSRYKPRKWNI